MAREIAKLGQKYLGQSMVAVNRTGADGGNAMSYLLAQPSDGYVVVAMTKSMMVSLNTSLKDKFRTDQFTYLARMEEPSRSPSRYGRRARSRALPIS